MGWKHGAGAILILAGLAACSGPTVNSQSYLGRSTVELMSADGVTARRYACRSTSNAARAHCYADGEILEAQARFGVNANAGMFSGMGARAEVNAEIARVARNVESEYGCALLGSRDTRQTNPFG